MSCGVGRRHGLDPALLWLWCRPEATAPIGPRAWEPQYAAFIIIISLKRLIIWEENASSLLTRVKLSWNDNGTSQYSKKRKRTLISTPNLAEGMEVGRDTGKMSPSTSLELLWWG